MYNVGTTIGRPQISIFVDNLTAHKICAVEFSYYSHEGVFPDDASA